LVVGYSFASLRKTVTVLMKRLSRQYLLPAPIACFVDDDSGITKDTDSRSIDYQQSAK